MAGLNVPVLVAGDVLPGSAGFGGDVGLPVGAAGLLNGDVVVLGVPSEAGAVGLLNGDACGAAGVAGLLNGAGDAGGVDAPDAAGFDICVAGLDGIGDDDGGGSFSVTVPEITAGPDRESGCGESAGFGSCEMTICGLTLTASLPGAPGIGKLSL